MLKSILNVLVNIIIKILILKKKIHVRAKRRTINHIGLIGMDGLVDLSNKQFDQRLPPLTTPNPPNPDSARNRENDLLNKKIRVFRALDEIIIFPLMITKQKISVILRNRPLIKIRNCFPSISFKFLKGLIFHRNPLIPPRHSKNNKPSSLGFAC